jgi:hypothetical protein
VQYLEGPKNVVADALSRWAYPAAEDIGDRTFDGTLKDTQERERIDLQEHIDDGLNMQTDGMAVQYPEMSEEESNWSEEEESVGYPEFPPTCNMFHDTPPPDPNGLHSMSAHEYYYPADADALDGLDRFEFEDCHEISCVSTTGDAHCDVSVFAMPDTVLWKDWNAAYRKDDRWKKVWNELKTKKTVEHYTIWNGRLRYNSRICVPESTLLGPCI